MAAYCDPVDSNTANVTGRSEERKRSMRRRREHELVAENAALRASLERKEQKSHLLCEKFALANERISILTSVLMNSLHKQWKAIVNDNMITDGLAEQRLAILRQQIMIIHAQMGEDKNVYAQAKLIELLKMIQN